MKKIASATYKVGDKNKILGVQFVCVSVGLDRRYQPTLPTWKFELREKFLTISGFDQTVDNLHDPYFVTCSKDEEEFLSQKRALDYLELWLRRWDVVGVKRSKKDELVALRG